MGRNPLDPPEPENYAEAVIPRASAPTPDSEASTRDWTPRHKHPDDPDDRTRHSYYVGDWVHSRLKALAKKHRVPISDLARYLLRDGIQRLSAGELDLETEETVVRRLR
jgi:hypothetical protein